MARASCARGFLRLASAALALTGISCSGSGFDPLDLAPRPTGAAAVRSISDLYIAESGRPILLPHTRLNEPKRGLWFAPPPRVAIDPVVPYTRTLRPPLRLVAGPVAQGFSGRGPPSIDDR